MTLQAETGMGLIMITHDMHVVAETADRVVVQYKGGKVEETDVLTLFEAPRHAYTKALLSALRKTPAAGVSIRFPTFSPTRRREKPHEETDAKMKKIKTPMLEIRNVKRDYLVPGSLFKPARVVHALKGVSFRLEARKTLAIVGESGCGKSTLARILTFIDAPTSGEILIEGKPVDARPGKLSADMRRKVQIVFQNPYGSLNPRQKIGDVLGEPLAINTTMSASERHDRAIDMLKKVDLGTRALQPLSAYVFRRSASTHRDRARVDAQSQALGAGRAGIGARSFRSGSGA